MKKIFLVMIILSLLVSGCENKSTKGTQTENHTLQNYSPDSKEIFSITSPDWEAMGSDDPFNNITLRSGQCTYALNVVDAPQDFYEKAVKGFVLNNSGTILTESPLSYTLTGGGYTFKIRTKSLFCEDRTYFALFTCPENQFDEKKAGEIFDSMTCKKEWKTPERKNRKLGLIVSPQNVTDIKSYFQAFNLARDNGVQITHHYALWGGNDRASNDLVFGTIRNKGLKASVVFSVIHTSVAGKLPDDIVFRGWDDAEFISRFSNFSIEYIERYRDVIEYVEIGNEVDIYFFNHKDELESYKVFYKKVYDNIKKVYPDIKVGTVFAYHELKSNNNFDVYRALSPIGDFDAFTLYVYNPGFVFDREPIEIHEHLQEIEKLTGERKFALEEVGWNAYGGLKGNEEDQRKAVAYFFDYMEKAPERLEFMNWFVLHDGTKKSCMESAKTFIEPGDPLLKNDKFISDFSDFICYLGLIGSDGTPRAGWYEFMERAREYGNS